MRMNKLVYVAAGLIGFMAGFLSTLHAQPAQRFDLKVRQDFFAGFNGDSEALARGMRASEEALAANPKFGEALVWHGSGLMFQAGQAFGSGDQAKGSELWSRALKEMQTAVELEPDNVAVRIPRGATLLQTSHHVSEAMAKPLLELGLADYQRSYELQQSYLETLGTHPRGELLFGLAEGYGREGDEAKAEKFFELIRTSLPNTVYAKRADEWMKNKSLPVSETGCVGCHVAK